MTQYTINVRNRRVVVMLNDGEYVEYKNIVQFANRDQALDWAKAQNQAIAGSELKLNGRRI